MGFKINFIEVNVFCGRGFEGGGEDGSIVMLGNMYVWGFVLRIGDFSGIIGNIYVLYCKKVGVSWDFKKIKKYKSYNIKICIYILSYWILSE